jgi:hypothetical protein
MRLRDVMRSVSVTDILESWRGVPAEGDGMAKKAKAAQGSKPQAAAKVKGKAKGAVAPSTAPAEEGSCIADAAVVDSPQMNAAQGPPNAAPNPPNEEPPKAAGSRKMQLNLKGLDKRGRNAIYTGAAVSIRIPIGAFPDKQPPQTLEVGDGFAGPKEPKARMTPEERKAARAAQPKLTLAEKVAKAEQRTAALRAKLQGSQGEQPSL